MKTGSKDCPRVGVATPLRGACQSCTSRQDTVIVRSAVGCHLTDSSAFATVNRIRPQDSLGPSSGLLRSRQHRKDRRLPIWGPKVCDRCGIHLRVTACETLSPVRLGLSPPILDDVAGSVSAEESPPSMPVAGWARAVSLAERPPVISDRPRQPDIRSPKADPHLEPRRRCSLSSRHGQLG